MSTISVWNTVTFASIFGKAVGVVACACDIMAMMETAAVWIAQQFPIAGLPGVTSLLFIKARLLKSAPRNVHKIPLPGKVM